MTFISDIMREVLRFFFVEKPGISRNQLDEEDVVLNWTSCASAKDKTLRNLIVTVDCVRSLRLLCVRRRERSMVL